MAKPPELGLGGPLGDETSPGRSHLSRVPASQPLDTTIRNRVADKDVLPVGGNRHDGQQLLGRVIPNLQVGPTMNTLWSWSGKRARSTGSAEAAISSGQKTRETSRCRGGAAHIR